MNPLEDVTENLRAAPPTVDAAPSEVSLVEVGGKISARHTLLCEQPLLVGESWARTWCETMRLEGRGVHGGWPGTVPEARVRILQHLDFDLARRGMPLLNPEEIVIVTNMVYARAKRDWLLEARGVKAPTLAESPRRAKS